MLSALHILLVDAMDQGMGQALLEESMRDLRLHAPPWEHIKWEPTEYDNTFIGGTSGIPLIRTDGITWPTVGDNSVVYTNEGSSDTIESSSTDGTTFSLEGLSKILQSMIYREKP